MLITAISADEYLKTHLMRDKERNVAMIHGGVTTMRKINYALEKALCLLGSLLVCVSFTQAATNDVTGVMPTLTVTFDASAVANANGTGSLTYSAEGTPTYVTSPNGKAIDMMLFTPYGNVTSVTTSSNDFTVSAFATLGPNNTGIMFHSH